MGVRGKLIGIHIDREHLLDLSIGEYTFLDLPRGKYDMVVSSTTIEGPDNAMVETSRDFVLDVAGADSVYLLFTLEESNFWELFRENLSDQYDAAVDRLFSRLDTIIVRMGGTPGTPLSTPRPGIGYTVQSISREAATEAASKLEAVKGAR